jgi:hypothetical protein
MAVFFMFAVWSGVVMLKNRSMSSTGAFWLDCFLQTAKLLTRAFSSGGQVPLNNGQSPPYPTRCTTWPPRARSVTHLKIALLEARKPFLGWSFGNRVFSVDNTNVSGGLCSFGASTEVKKKVSEMCIFLNLTLHSFGPENFVPLVQIGKFQKVLTEENESYRMVITHSLRAILAAKNSSKTKTART